jgi:hypothetical protein
MKSKLELAISELWQISRTALAGMETVPTRHDRMCYVKRELIRSYPELIAHFNGSNKKLWFAIEDSTQVFSNY